MENMGVLLLRNQIILLICFVGSIANYQIKTITKQIIITKQNTNNERIYNFMIKTQFNTAFKDLMEVSQYTKFENMTPEQFKVVLETQRLHTTPSLRKTLRRNDGIRTRDSTTDSVIYTPTQDQYYRIFINDILRNIQSGGTDYCFRWYQVKELLRFHKHTLQCRIIRENNNKLDFYFEVCLPNNWQEIEKNIKPEPRMIH